MFLFLFSGAGFVHACHLEGGCEIGNTFTRNLQKEALPVHAELVDSEEVSLPGGSWTSVDCSFMFLPPQGFTALTEEGRRSRQVEEQRSKVDK